MRGEEKSEEGSIREKMWIAKSEGRKEKRDDMRLEKRREVEIKRR